jgi:hypothetical protein
MLFAGKCIKLEIIMLSEIRQIQKNKYHMFSLICRIHTFKNKTCKWKSDPTEEEVVTREGIGGENNYTHVQKCKN